MWKLEERAGLGRQIWNQYYTGDSLKPWGVEITQEGCLEWERGKKENPKEYQHLRDNKRKIQKEIKKQARCHTAKDISTFLKNISISFNFS